MELTWLGHSAFKLAIKDRVILIDPFLTGNPKFSGTVEDVQKGVTDIVLTHGHDDHVGDTAAIAKATGATVTANFEICTFLGTQGIEAINPGNTGGTVPCGPVSVSFTKAFHSSGTVKDGQSVYLGNPLGVVLRAEGEKTVYHMGDTDIFSDMALVNELYRPAIGIVPIGDRFTMGAHSAAMACRRYFDFETVIPCHYGTFPIIDQTADRFVNQMGDQGRRVRVLEPMKPVTL